MCNTFSLKNPLHNIVLKAVVTSVNEATLLALGILRYRGLLPASSPVDTHFYINVFAWLWLRVALRYLLFAAELNYTFIYFIKKLDAGLVKLKSRQGRADPTQKEVHSHVESVLLRKLSTRKPQHFNPSLARTDCNKRLSFAIRPLAVS
ncbi:unnamed protein product [Leptosia nina]|uniref:Uncharacterized protein n=1 Tax=Leptosia nina TaxID=320188 RepID=A0AAV1JQ75_9NEOP